MAVTTPVARNALMVCLSALAIAWCPDASARPGDLDTRFAGSGMVNVGFGGSDASYCIAPTVIDGKIVAAGFTDAGLGGDFAVLRLNRDGSTDNSFGAGLDGRTRSDFGFDDYIFGVESHRTGTSPGSPIVLVAAGGAQNASGNDDLALARYSWTDGSPVTSFDSDGKVTTNLGGNENIEGLAFQADHKIVVGGSTDLGGNLNFVVARYTSIGALDPVFNSGNVVITNLGGEDYCMDVAIQSDGRIVAAGSGAGKFVVVRYTSAGALDSFGTGGVATVEFPGASSGACDDVVVLPDGRILGAGRINSSDVVMARLNTDGSPDPSFGSGGRVVTNQLTGSPGMTLQPDGKILLIGSNFTIVRFNSNGSLDTGFGDGGRVTLDFGSGDFASEATIRDDGTIAVTGTTSPTLNNFAIASLKTAQGDVKIGRSLRTLRGENVYNRNGQSQTEATRIRRGGGRKTFLVAFQNDTAAIDSFKLRGTRGNRLFQIKYLKGRKEVTARMIAGGLNTGAMPSGSLFLVRAEVTAVTPEKRKRRVISLSAVSAIDSTAIDVARLSAQSR